MATAHDIRITPIPFTLTDLISLIVFITYTRAALWLYRNRLFYLVNLPGYFVPGFIKGHGARVYIRLTRLGERHG